MSFTRRQLVIGSGLVLIAGASTGYTLFKEPAYNSPVFAQDGLAIRGTDPVAYFTDKKPIQGTSEHSLEWNGAKWQFASAENLKLFSDNPKKYAPAYGGYCAWAVAEKSELFSTQPVNWAIVDDRLYLNYNDAIQERWNTDIANFIELGDKNWAQIVQQFEV